MSVIMERRTSTGGTISTHFESIGELMDYKFPDGQCQDNVQRFNEYLYQQGPGRAKDVWFGPGIKSSKEVINRALLGDPELYNEHLKYKCDELNKALGTHTKTYRQPVRKVKRRKVKRDFGDEVDIHKIYQGQLDTAWRTTERVEVDSKHHLVTLFVDIGGNMNVSAVDSLWRTAVAIKLIDELQSAGKAVQVIVGGLSNQTYLDARGVLATASITVKKYNQNLSVERLAAMTSIGFYRTFGFACKMVPNYRVCMTLGHSALPTQNNLPIHIREEVEKGHTKVVIVKRADSLSSAIQSIKDSYSQMESFAKED